MFHTHHQTPQLALPPESSSHCPISRSTCHPSWLSAFHLAIPRALYFVNFSFDPSVSHQIAKLAYASSSSSTPCLSLLHLKRHQVSLRYHYGLVATRRRWH